jgi:hypothetical protein
MAKSKRMRWAGHVACMGDNKCIQGFEGDAVRKETARKI